MKIDMKKRIGMAAVVCLLGLGIWLIGGKAGEEGKNVAVVQEESTSEMVIPDEQTSAVNVESVQEDESESGAEIETEPESEIEVEPESEIEVEAGAEIESEEEMEVVEEVSATEETSLIGSYAIANVERYVNVRNAPSTDGDVIGKMYDDAVAEIIAVDGENGDWFQITSGNVEGYIKSEFFLYGKEAEEVLDDYVSSYAKVEVNRLNVRAEKSTDSERIGRLNKGEKVKLLEDCGEWVKIQYTEQKIGYVSAEYVVMAEEYSYAKTLEEDRAERDTKKERKKSQSIPAMTGVFPDTTYKTNEELRTQIVNYALQYVGNSYVSGGSSLSGGTDCSGFTCFIYKDFGYSISRTPQGQFTGAGRSIDYGEIQPGDIICYSSNGGKSCTHVALYIGNGQIVHAANSRKGVITAAADYDTIIGIRNVID